MTLVSKYTVGLFLVLLGVQLYAQDTLALKTTRIPESQLVSGQSYVIDTIMDGKAFFKKTIEPLKQIDLTQALQDDEFASDIDKKWMEELYSTALFDTIYRDVTSLKYDAVYYPELTTDTLKARLERLNARTPFNVEYNPQLENLIKRWLKN